MRCCLNCKKTGDTYVATIKYYILDYYDWEKDSNLAGGIVHDGEMYELHVAGLAREYRTIGLYEITYNWKGGEKLCIDGDQLYIK